MLRFISWSWSLFSSPSREVNCMLLILADLSSKTNVYFTKVPVFPDMPQVPWSFKNNPFRGFNSDRCRALGSKIDGILKGGWWRQYTKYKKDFIPWVVWKSWFWIALREVCPSLYSCNSQGRLPTEMVYAFPHNLLFYVAIGWFLSRSRLTGASVFEGTSSLLCSWHIHCDHLGRAFSGSPGNSILCCGTLALEKVSQGDPSASVNLCLY